MFHIGDEFKKIFGREKLAYNYSRILNIIEVIQNKFK